MANLSTLIALSERIQAATGPDRELDAAIFGVFGPIDEKHLQSWCKTHRPARSRQSYIEAWSLEYTGSLDEAIALLNSVLPGWWWKAGTCCVSDDACIAPDYNDPKHGERLAEEFPLPDERYLDRDEPPQSLTWGSFDEGFDVDRRPPGNVALALLEAMLDALIYIEEMRFKSEESR